MKFTENFKKNLAKSLAVDYMNYIFKMNGGRYDYNQLDQIGKKEYESRVIRFEDNLTVESNLNITDGLTKDYEKTSAEFKAGLNNPEFWGHKDLKVSNWML